jgi:hypothetical protein
MLVVTVSVDSHLAMAVELKRCPYRGHGGSVVIKDRTGPPACRAGHSIGGWTDQKPLVTAHPT